MRRQVESYRIYDNTRRIMWEALKRRRNNGRVCGKSKYLPYTWQQLADHLEEQFTEGMTWQNYGTNWSARFRRPYGQSIAFTSREDEEFRTLFALWNLYPGARKCKDS